MKKCSASLRATDRAWRAEERRSGRGGGRAKEGEEGAHPKFARAQRTKKQTTVIVATPRSLEPQPDKR